ncbi:MAG: hypothetical protein NPIRA05_02950 [Nitrospirales bacterium]|nr:MAG: hypothetical protein NPIRA05_02950 [Nitrospirales bacterium]
MSDAGRDATLQQWRIGLAHILRSFGYLGLDLETGNGVVDRASVHCCDNEADVSSAKGSLFTRTVEAAEAAGLSARAEAGVQILYEEVGLLRSKKPVFRPLLDFVSFDPGPDLDVLVQTAQGRPVVAWQTSPTGQRLVCGLDVVAQIIRYSHGDPARARFTGNKNLWGAGHEQPAYLYVEHVCEGYEAEPWVDRLGQRLVNWLSGVCGLPSLLPLPGGAKGAVLLTGDDDQAELAKYAQQQQVLDGFPITYLMMSVTNQTAETVSAFPDSVEFGMHVDALECPGDYDQACADQLCSVREMAKGKPVRTIRNHGHLNAGYWGHLQAWQENDLCLDLNIRGLDGTCPTGSYLPFSVFGEGVALGKQFSLFSTFSDSMKAYQGLSERQQVGLIKAFAKRIEKNYPGVLVFNFHPQNVEDGLKVHKAVVSLGRRPGWTALGANSYLSWLEAFWTVRLKVDAGNFSLTSQMPVESLAVCAGERTVVVNLVAGDDCPIESQLT